MTPQEIKEARRTLGLTQNRAAVLTGGEPDSSNWRKYERGTRPIPEMKKTILAEMLAGVGNFTINKNVEDDTYWVEHTRFPRLKWRIEGEDLYPVTVPPPGFIGDYTKLTAGALAAWRDFHN